jgi:hypothetical protein
MGATSHRSVDGEITWFLRDGSELSQSTLRGILRGTDEIAFDCCDMSEPASPRPYNVSLKKIGLDSFEGEFRCTARDAPPSGPVRCRLYANSEGFALVGVWIEEAKRYEWFAELARQTAQS